MSFIASRFDFLTAKPVRRAEVRAVRERLLNALVFIFGIVGGISILIGVSLAVRAGQHGYAAAYGCLCAVLVTAALLARRIPYTPKAVGLLVVGMGMGVLTLFRLGLSGVGIEIITAFTVLATVLFGLRQGLLLLGIGLAAVAAAAAAHVTGLVPTPADTLLTSYSAVAWTNAGIIFGLFTFALVLSPQLLLHRLERAMKEQEHRADELQRANEELERQIVLRERAERDRKRIEEQLHQAQKLEALGTLAGGIAHDFNNLLTAIQGRASLARAGLDETGQRHQHLSCIDDCVQSAAGLTSQLLGLARGGKYDAKPTDLNQLLRRCVELFGRTRKEITIELALEPELQCAQVDSHQVDQVVLNLLINASQAMPDGGAIAIETANITLDPAAAPARDLSGGSFVCITVADTGVGIEPEIIARIFDPFFSTKGQGSGTGLGLASAYGIAKNHGGTIDVESELGHGTTFRILLPAAGRQTPAKNARPVHGVPVGSETVLLVDDEAAVLDVTGALLEELGYTVLTASSGVAALEILTSNPGSIDLVVLDMVMPELSGAETFERLRSLDEAPKVLLSSGYSAEGKAAALLDDGCDGFLKKPYGLAPLARKIREILDTPSNA